MPDRFFVAVDRDGVEHNPGGDVHWTIPGANGAPLDTAIGRALELREPKALLEVLDELIFEAEPTEAAGDANDGVVRVPSARLVRRTAWDTESAARFAIDCAEHVLGSYGDVALPGGTTFAALLSEAEHDLEEVSSDHADHLGKVALLLALHRLRKGRRELGDMATEVIGEDEAQNLEALDDPAYEALGPVIDAVLAAISALRHHAVFGALAREEDKRENDMEHAVLERQTSLRIPPPAEPTPWGPVEVGGSRVPSYEPSWAEAREAARHARTVAKNERGASGEAGETAWQAERLAEILAG